MISDKVFVDTAAWIALLNEKDRYHLPAIDVMARLRQQKTALVTTGFILLEVADALSLPSIRRKTIGLVENLFLENLAEFSKLKIIPVSQELWMKGWDLYKQREDKDWGLTDCISFVIMQQEKITQAFTADRHFEQAGFVNFL